MEERSTMRSFLRVCVLLFMHVDTEHAGMHMSMYVYFCVCVFMHVRLTESGYQNSLSCKKRTSANNDNMSNAY